MGFCTKKIYENLEKITNPMSTSTKTTAINVTTHVIDSNLHSLWNRLRSPACVYIPFSATIMIPDKTHYFEEKKIKNVIFQVNLSFLPMNLLGAALEKMVRSIIK